MSLLSNSIFRLVSSSSRFTRSFSAASKLLDRNGMGPSTPSKTLYVGSLNFDTTSQDLQDTCEKYGTVVSSRIIMDRERMKSKGFGYVEFSDEETAIKAKSELQDATIDGFRIRVDYATPKPMTSRSLTEGNDRYPRGGGRRDGATDSFSARQAAPSATLYIGNLPHALTVEEFSEILREEFGQDLGSEDVRFPMGRPDSAFPSHGGEEANNKGFGYVSLESVEQATSLMESMRQKVADGWSLDGRIPRIGYEEPRAPRQERSFGSFGGGSRGGDRGGDRYGSRDGGFSSRGGRGGGGRGAGRGGSSYGGGYGGRERSGNSDRYEGSRSGGRRGGSEYDF